MPDPLDPDAALMLRVKRGDRAAFTELVEKYKQPVMNFIFRSLRDETEAEDLAQNVFLQVYKSRDRYERTAKFSTWLFTIARNLVIDLSRKRTMSSLDEMSESGEDDRPFEIAGGGPSPLEQFQLSEDRAEVSQVLLRLESSYREVLVLRFYDELSLEEIAGVTKAPLSTVKSRLYTALDLLKQTLAPVSTGGAE